MKCKEQKKIDKGAKISTEVNGDKIKIRLTGFDDKNEVIYKTARVDFVFSRVSVLEYCKSKDSALNNNFM